MELKEIGKKEEWEEFLEKCSEKTFLQSWNWGEFNNRMGEKIWRFGVLNSGNMIAAALVCKIPARRGTFLFVPHGPVMMAGLTFADKKEIMELFMVRLEQLAEEEKACFIFSLRLHTHLHQIFACDGQRIEYLYEEIAAECQGACC